MRRIGMYAGVWVVLGAWTAAQGQVVVGFDEGGPPVVRVYDPVNPTPPLASFFPTTPSFSGGVRVAVGDVNGDGVQDTMTGLGPGVLAEFRVYSGMGTGQLLLTNANTYNGYTGGIHVAAGDVDGDGRADVITGTATAATHVKVFSGSSGALLASFLAFPGFTGGVTVGAGDVNDDGFDDIIVAAGPGGNGHIKVFSGVSGAEIRSFFAFQSFSGGVYVASGDVNGDGRDDIIVGAGAGAPGGHVKVFDGVTGAEIASFFAYGPSFMGGVRVGAIDRNGDGIAEILAGSGPGILAEVRTYSGTGAFIASFPAGQPGFTGGTFLAGARSISGCYADCNGSGTLTIADFACFQSKFVGGSPYGDCNGDGGRTIADFACFQTRFVQGCP